MKIQITISKDKGIMGGQWCISETRIPLELLLGLLDKGWSLEEINREHWPGALDGKVFKIK